MNTLIRFFSRRRLRGSVESQFLNTLRTHNARQ